MLDRLITSPSRLVSGGSTPANYFKQKLLPCPGWAWWCEYPLNSGLTIQQPWLLINFLMKVILANFPCSSLLNLQIYFSTNNTPHTLGIVYFSLIWSRNILNLHWFNRKIFKLNFKSRWDVYEDRLLSDLRIVRAPDWFHSTSPASQPVTACWNSLEEQIH